MLKNKSTKNKTIKESLKKPEVFIMTQSNTEELKNARSATTGEEFTTLDERIDCEVERLNKKIEVSMLQQESEESHVVENSVEGMTTDMVVKGRTLFNHIGKYLTHGGCEWNNNKATVSGISLSNGYAINLECTAIDINKSYILGVYIESLNDNAKNLGFSMGVLDSTNSSWNRVVSITPVKGWNFVELTLDKNKTLGNVRFRNSKLPTDLELDIVFTNFIMIEKTNQYSFVDNPCYFKSFKSFGQQEDKINILSSGKNILTTSEFKNLEFDGAEVTILNSNSINIKNNNLKTWRNCYYDYILKPNTNYVAYCEKVVIREGEAGILPCYSTGESINGVVEGTIRNNYVAKFNTGNRTDIRIRFQYAWNTPTKADIDYIDIQLEEGTTPTTFEPHKEDKKDILLHQYGFNEGLRGLKSVQDELDSNKNKAIKRIEKYTFTGDEVIRKSNTYGDVIRFDYKLSNVKHSSDIMCNNFTKGIIGKENLECINVHYSDNLIQIQIKVNKLETQDAEGFKKWLQANPTTVYYELAEPIETPLNKDINLKTFGERTYVTFENSLKGTSSFKAPVDTTATIARLNKENKSLGEENINLRQDLESTALTLTDSDLELVKQNVDMDFRLMEVESALDIPLATLSSNIKFKNKKGEVKSMARSPYEMMKIVILSGDYDKEDYMYKVGKYYERGRMTKEEHDELMSLMTADEVISK